LDQVVQIVGALLILVAFVLAQCEKLDQRSYIYLVLNFFGSAILAIQALEQRQWGFVLLEGCWAAVSLRGVAMKRFRA